MIMSLFISSLIIVFASGSQCSGIALVDVVKTGWASFFNLMVRLWPLIWQKLSESDIVSGYSARNLL